MCSIELLSTLSSVAPWPTAPPARAGGRRGRGASPGRARSGCTSSVPVTIVRDVDPRDPRPDHLVLARVGQRGARPPRSSMLNELAGHQVGVVDALAAARDDAVRDRQARRRDAELRRGQLRAAPCAQPRPRRACSSRPSPCWSSELPAVNAEIETFVSTWAAVTWSIDRPSSSAAICGRAVGVPWPSSTSPWNSVTVLSGLIWSQESICVGSGGPATRAGVSGERRRRVVRSAAAPRCRPRSGRPRGAAALQEATCARAPSR